MTNIKRIISEKKIAIVHDALLEDGGSERVLLALSEILPKAGIYTSLVNTDTQTYKKLKKRIKRIWSNNPLLAYRASYFKPFINLYWENLDLTGYDLVISSSHSFSSKSIVTGPDTVHVCYCYTPPKFLYPELAETDVNNKAFQSIKRIVYSPMRNYDFVAAQRPDFFIAISREVQRRINKYYRRNSVLIYPPVSVPPTPPRRRKIKNYYMLISRLYKVKGVDLAIDTFNQLKKKLVIVGVGNELGRLRKKAGKNIIFKGYLDENIKIAYLKQAKALIFPSIDEDFGIVPVEAMAQGVPVIALFSGGTKETVADGKTGIFFHEFNQKALVGAVKRFETMNFDPNTCYKQAKKFSEDRFEKEIRKFLQGAINEKVKI